MENIISVTGPRARKGDEAEREREEGVGKEMGGSPSLTDLEVDVVDIIVEL